MRISTKGEYGLRALTEMAKNHGQGPISLKTISQTQSISINYLEQLMLPLRRAGLVVSVRGAQGGYKLALPPEEVVVGDIIRVLEGPIAPRECVGEDHAVCQQSAGCATRDLWIRLRESMEEVLDGTTLADLSKDVDVPD